MANARSVACDLGRGAHGHLGLVLNNTEYVELSAILYAQPDHPGTLKLASGLMQYMRTEMCDDHLKKLQLFREANCMNKVVLKKLSHTVPEIYLKHFKDQHSNAFIVTVQSIFIYFFETCGQITDDKLRDKELNLGAQVFDITQPVIQVYNAVENLQQIAKVSSNDYTNAQILSIGIMLIKNHKQILKEA